jgi:hypothetical protein
MTVELDTVFARLKAILLKHTGSFTVKEEGKSISLCGKVGPATLKVWNGEMRKPILPVVWLVIKKNYVSYHLMPVYMNPKLQASISPDLKKRMQGKSCFNFKTVDEKLIRELDQLTAKGIEDFKKMGFVS